MNKILFQFSMLAIGFFLTWFLLSKVGFVEYFKIKDLSKSNEEKIGNLIIESLKRTENEIISDSLRNVVLDIKDRLCKGNNIKKEEIKIYILEKDELNAFALPNKNIVIYSGLLQESKNPEEVAGVMAHELAHIELNHVTKKLVKEVGLSVLMSIAGGNNSSEILRELGKLLSSSAYDRTLESEADSYAVKYLTKSNIDPEHLANFLYRISDQSINLPRQFEWISTHPDSKERAMEILKLKKNEKFSIKPLYSDSVWTKFKHTMEAYEQKDNN